MKYYGLSDKGIVRKENQDCFSIEENADSDLLVAVLCDGMGGHAAGRLASNVAAKIFMENVQTELSVSEGKDRDWQKILVSACSKANRALVHISDRYEEYSGLGTTLVGAVINEAGEAVVVNIGDSRAYLLSHVGGEILQITTDHSLVESYVRAGIITPEEARTHPKKNIITRALGSEPEPEADIFTLSMNTHDVLLLCSDGLSNPVTDREILLESERTDDPEELCRALLSIAYERGARDNVTIVAVVKT